MESGGWGAKLCGCAPDVAVAGTATLRRGSGVEDFAKRKAKLKIEIENCRFVIGGGTGSWRGMRFKLRIFGGGSGGRTGVGVWRLGA